MELLGLESRCLATRYSLNGSGGFLSKKALHTTGTDFARMHARAVYTHSINEFRQRFLGVRLLVIDDLQILKTRSSAQQMLCNIIDHYQANDCMLVVCLPTLPTRSYGLR